MYKGLQPSHAGNRQTHPDGDLYKRLCSNRIMVPLAMLFLVFGFAWVPLLYFPIFFNLFNGNSQERSIDILPLLWTTARRALIWTAFVECLEVLSFLWWLILWLFDSPSRSQYYNFPVLPYYVETAFAIIVVIGPKPSRHKKIPDEESQVDEESQADEHKQVHGKNEV